MTIQLIDVYKGFENKDLFTAVNLSIAPGETVCIKTGVLDGGTTLLKLMTGLVAPDRGQVLLKSKAFDEHSPKDLFNSVAMCFEEGGLLDVFTNYNNIVLPMLYHFDTEHSEIHDRIYRIAEPLNLIEHLGKEPFQLNDVQKRLLNLCKALVIEPDVLVVDELQSGMSKDIRDSTLSFLLSEQQRLGFSLIMTTTAGDRTDFADRTFEINNNDLVEETA